MDELTGALAYFVQGCTAPPPAAPAGAGEKKRKGRAKGKAAVVAQYEEAISSGRCPLKVVAVTVKRYRSYQRQGDSAKDPGLRFQIFSWPR